MPIHAFAAGDTKRWLLTLTDPESGAPLDLTGATVIFTMKVNEDDADDSPGAINVFVTNHAAPGVPGQTYLELPASTSALLLPGKAYNYWLKAVLGNGIVTTAQKGRVQVLHPGTRLTAAPNA